MKQHNFPAFNPNSKVSSRFRSPLVQACFRTVIFIAAIFCGSSATAVGLGAMRVESALGQPLHVQIGLLGSDSSDADNRCFKARVTSLDGAPLGTVGVHVKNSGPAPAIVLSTTQPVNEPAVTLGVEYNCSSQTRRDYQILLDLPPFTPLAVDGHRSAVASSPTDTHDIEFAPQFLPDSAVAENVAGPKKKRRHRPAGESKAADNQLQPQLSTANEVKERHSGKSPSGALRNVLRLESGDRVDDNLNGAEGMHLALSRSLFGSTPTVDARPSDPANIQESTRATMNSDASSRAADPGLQELQAKIRVLEAETGELRKVNTKHLAALETAQKSNDSNGYLRFLYFLLFACVSAIVWLLWQTKQIRSEIAHSSWNRIVPLHDHMEERETHHADNGAFREHDAPLHDINSLDALRHVTGIAVTGDLTTGHHIYEPLPEGTAAPASEDANEHDYKFNANLRSALPSAEEIIDEIQQVEFWMDLRQPLRAIEILESNWGVEPPSSPLPWLYLFDLYRMVGNKEKYEELTKRFEQIFNGRVVPWGEGEALTHLRSLEEFPFLMKKIIELWSTDELVPFMESLLIDDRDGRRHGFDLAAYRDILFLTHIAYVIRSSEEFVTEPIDVPESSVIK